MTTPNLTPTQLDVLRKMAAGWTLVVYSRIGGSAYCELDPPPGDFNFSRTVRMATFTSMLHKGAVVPTTPRRSIFSRDPETYTITPSGRAAAEEGR